MSVLDEQTEINKMKIHSKQINGKKVSAYNDSNSEWVVNVEGSAIHHRFDKKKWTMEKAMNFAIELFKGV